MKRTPARLALVLAALFLAPPAALAQTSAAASAPAADAEFAAQKSAFLALPQATRKALQDALVWLGFYNGANDGDFGKRTRDSIVAWQRSVKATPDGVLGPTLVQALLAAADKARAAVGFQAFTDQRTGARVEAPAKLLGKGGTRLEFASSNEADLAPLYGRLSAEIADPQGLVQGDEARRLLRGVRPGRGGEILFAVRDERERQSACARLHLCLSGG